MYLQGKKLRFNPHIYLFVILQGKIKLPIKKNQETKHI